MTTSQTDPTATAQADPTTTAQADPTTTPHTTPATPTPAPAPRPRFPAWLRAAAGPIILLGTLLLASVAVSAALRPLLVGATTTGQLLGQALTQLLVGAAMVGATVAWARFSDRLRPRDIGLRVSRRSAGLFGIGLAAAVLAWFLPGLLLGSSELLRPARTAEGPVWAVILLTFTVGFALQGFPEELMFRGYLLVTLRARPVLAVIVSTILFGIPHLLSSGGQQNALERLYYLALPVGFGFAAAALVLLTGSLWPAVGVHAGYHFTTPVAAAAGIGSGPDVWIGSGVVFALVGVGALVAWHRRGRSPIALTR